MKKDPGLVFRVLLMLGDSLSIIFSFAFAYYIRTHLDQRPYYFESEITSFITTILLFIPFWLIILASLGLYTKNIFLNHSRLPELGRLFIASIIGTMGIITYDFFGQNDLFPVRVIALIATLLCFFTIAIFRLIFRLIRRQIAKTNYGTLRTVIIGNHRNTEYLSSHIMNFPEDGYQVVGIVANNRFIPKELAKRKYSSLKDALKNTQPDVIFQTDERQTSYVYRQAINRHLLYYFVPSESMLSAHMGQIELVGNTPAVLVKVTPLIGGIKLFKRFFDIIFSLLAITLTLIPMIIIWLILKLSDFKHSPIFSEVRLSQYNRKFEIFKFRSMKPEYSGMSPEAAFKKMGKPELIKKYRKNGDFLVNDPRITRFGKLLRSSSLDELPQFFNVLKGDISLIGPRALVPGELRDYGDRSLLLSVKSGLTGLAQVSGRRDISFEERRALDIYYVQNWSPLLDFRILMRTIRVVINSKGAK